jgi:hypothetical protein
MKSLNDNSLQSVVNINLKKRWITHLASSSDSLEKIKDIYRYIDNKKSKRPLALLEVFLAEIKKNPFEALEEVNRLRDPSQLLKIDNLNYIITKSWIKRSKDVVPAEPPSWLSGFFTDEEIYPKIKKLFQEYSKVTLPLDKKAEEQKEEVSKVVGSSTSSRILAGVGYNSDTVVHKIRPLAIDSHTIPKSIVSIQNAGWDTRPFTKITTNNQNQKG